MFSCDFPCTGIPAIPTQLILDLNPRNVSELILSWLPPENQLSEVDVTYTVEITGPSFNLSDITRQTFIVLENNVSLDCQLHLFSVFATNPAGSGPSASVMDTIPICEFKSSWGCFGVFVFVVVVVVVLFYQFYCNSS